MKKVTIKSSCMSGEWLLISNFEELSVYMEHTSGQTSDLISSLIKNAIPKERWDHFITQNAAGSILAHTLASCKIKGKSPIFEIDKFILQKFDTMMKWILEGEKLLVNDRGGFCTMPPDCTIVSEREVDFSFKPTYSIKSDTSYINLENDPKLEDFSKKYLQSKDENYSYIVNLGHHSKEQLTDIFSEFVINGGHTVYVYTTGMKTDQMYQYFDIAYNCGINNFEFDFNSGVTPAIQDFLNYAQTKATVAFKEV